MDLNYGAGGTAATARDVDLGALRVELGHVDLVLLNTDVLETDEILAVRDFLGESEGHVVLVPGGPEGVDVGRAFVCVKPTDLKPVTVTLVVRDGAGSLGHVDHAGAGVLNDLVEPDLSTDLVTGLDISSLSRRVEGTGVATDILRVDGNRR